MAGKMDKAKGRLKEAAGALTGDRKLKRQGKKDKIKGTAKEKIDKAAARSKETVDKVAHSRKRTVNRDNM